jgi:hypothetical protein
MRTFTTRVAGLGIAAVVAGVLLSGCEPPDLPTGNLPTGNGTPFTDPGKAELYREMTRPLPYRGGDINSRCGEWEAATSEDARQMRAAYQRCLTEGRNP